MHLFVEYAQQFARFQRNARLYLISNVLSGVSVGILLLLYNLYLASLGYGADFIGAVLFIGTLGAGLAIFPAGICVDRFGSKAVLIWSSVLIGILGAAQILFRQPLPLLVSGFFAGVAGAALLVVNAPFLTTNSTPEERPHLFSLNISLSLISTVIGQVIGGVLPVEFHTISCLMAPLPRQLSWLLAQQPEPRSYQLALLFAGIIAGPSFIPLFLLSDDRPRPMVQTAGNLNSTHQSPTRRTSVFQAILFHVHQILSSLTRIRQLLPGIVRSPIFLLVLVQVLIGMGAGLFIPYFNIYFVNHLKASSAVFGLLAGGATAITALLTLVAPTLASRIGKIPTIVMTQLASIPLLITLGLINLLPLAAALFLFRQGFMDMSMGILQVFSMEAVPKQRRGLANSGYQAAFQVAWAVMAPLGGLIIVRSGYPPVFLFAALFYLLAIGTLWGKFGRRKREGKTEVKQIDEQESKVTLQH